MQRVKNISFYLGIGALFTHELDAVPNHEWRVLPLLQALPDEIGMIVFVAAHVPLFAILVALIASANARTRHLTRTTIGAILVIHGVAHWLSTNRAAYEFSSTLSNVLIFGGAVFGALYLLLEARERRASPAGLAP